MSHGEILELQVNEAESRHNSMMKNHPLANGLSNSPSSRFHVARVSVPNDTVDIESRRVSLSCPVSRKGSIDHNTSIYDTRDTREMRSFRHYTHEALPNINHYRHAASIHGHISRPTMDQLHGNLDENYNHEPKVQGESNAPTSVKFGWIVGVFVRCLAGIWGILLFLRLSWMVAHAGTGLASVVILVSSIVTLITAISMSAICTNGEVKGGGTYYMISRSLGPEFGGSIGVIFSLANAVAVAMYTVGFAESVNMLLKTHGMQMVEGDLDNMRIIGCSTLIVFLIIVFIGTAWEAKCQVFMIVILIGAILDFFIGSLKPPDQYEHDRGFVGWNWTLTKENFYPKFRDGESFFSVFSVYFPAVTGILAGANISGDLKDPQKAIPLGTILAIIVTSISYMAFTIIFGSTCLREVIVNGSVVEIEGIKQGLYTNYSMVELIALYGPLIYGGLFCAALSSALGSFVSAPKVFQALCQDKLFPFIEFFGKGSSKNNEPYRGYVLTFVIAFACCMVADLNVIAPIISNFFLAAYTLINFSCFHASYSKSLGFRPSFRYYNKWISLCMSLLCGVIMFIMNWITALITFVIVLALYFIVLYRKPDANWGSSTQAQTYRSALYAAHKLNFMPDHIKTYRPQILLFSGSTTARPALVDFTYSIVRGIGMLACGHIIQTKLSHKIRESIVTKNNEWLRIRKVKAFYSLVDDDNFLQGASSLIRATGIGKLKPNIVFLGYKSDWQQAESQNSLLNYFNVIHEILNHHMGICILRLENGFDYSHYGSLTKIFESMEEKNHHAFFNRSFTSVELVSKSVQESLDKCTDDRKTSSSTELQGTCRLAQDPTSSSSSSSENNNDNKHSIIIEMMDREQRRMSSFRGKDRKTGPKELSTSDLMNIDMFRRKQKKSTIDIWWLYDDGGLTLLIPYILSNRKQWRGCKLRVFALANKKDDLNRDQRNMVALLNKFRINYTDVIVIPNIVKPPSEENQKKFANLIQKWRVKDSTENCPPNMGHNNLLITDTEFAATKNKSNRHIRLRELLEEYSMDSSLIVMTLPMPRLNSCSATMFMAWLETLTNGMPPFLLIRGSQQSVLTFYS
ncbi:bumetanide-sensitive sodium-(potassium)-chloride cotransporter-like [Brevipalpus obovatus]|uniref:bumetanide-sensitive sodium-(potassium)-chloride cotransporter-like n=1 Tax=Brevipalpus obovatus TaxID=246614 RepID=UPI003D9E96D8